MFHHFRRKHPSAPSAPVPAARKPEWVSTDRNGYKTIQTGGLHALEVEAIRSLKAENDDLKARMKTLETARKPVTMNGDFGLGSGGLGIALAGVF